VFYARHREARGPARWDSADPVSRRFRRNPRASTSSAGC